MQSGHLERIYIDSNIWFAYLSNVKYELKSDKANDIIYRIVNKQNEVAVISRLVIIEVINIIRNRIVQRTKYAVTLEIEKSREIREIIDNKIKRFIDIITRWSKSKKLEIYYTKSPIEGLFQEIMRIQQLLKGQIERIHQCKVCRNRYKGYIYRGVDHWDILHILIAREAKVNYFETFDKGYNELKEYFKEFEIKIY